MKKALPKAPGVYLFKDDTGQVIYIGKAKNIQRRVQSYFSKKEAGWKVQALLDEHRDIDYILVRNETEALLLEAQLIRDHQPRFNILLKDGQPFVYLLFTKPAGCGLPKL
ncbi:GIY-YIG nuclease family protein, partial [Candidatus Dependentiae bacterium]